MPCMLREWDFTFSFFFKKKRKKLASEGVECLDSWFNSVADDFLCLVDLASRRVAPQIQFKTYFDHYLFVIQLLLHPLSLC